MRRVITLVIVAVLAAVVAGPTGLASAAPGGGGDAAAEHRRIVDFWTAERRASAIPRDIVLGGGPSERGKPGGSGGTTTAVKGASWTATDPVVTSTGKVFFSVGSTRYVCSGSLVDSAHGSLVLTAGHCVHDGAGGLFVTNWAFYPAYAYGPDPTLGAWTASDLFTTNLWAGTNNGFDDDAGFAVVYQTDAGTLEEAVTDAGGTVPRIEFSGHGKGVEYHAFGYPAAQKYNGQSLTYCAGPVKVGWDGHQSLALGCDMTGGSSGGPWYREFNGARIINSLNSYGYASVRNTMFGPIFSAGEQGAYTGADTTPDCTGSPTGYRCVDYYDVPPPVPATESTDPGGPTA